MGQCLSSSSSKRLQTSSDSESKKFCGVEPSLDSKFSTSFPPGTFPSISGCSQSPFPLEPTFRKVLIPDSAPYCSSPCETLCYNCKTYEFVSSFNSDQCSSDWHILSSHADKCTLLSSILSLLLKFETLNRYSQSKTRFDAISVPAVSITAYARRLMNYFKSPVSCFVVGLILLDRVMHKHPHHVVFDPLSAHRLLAAAFTIAVKTYDDRIMPNSYYAEVIGVTPAELNRLEIRFLLLLEHKTLVSRDEFFDWVDMLKRYAVNLETGRVVSNELVPSGEKTQIVIIPSRSLSSSSSTAATQSDNVSCFSITQKNTHEVLQSGNEGLSTLSMLSSRSELEKSAGIRNVDVSADDVSQLGPNGCCEMLSPEAVYSKTPNNHSSQSYHLEFMAGAVRVDVAVDGRIDKDNLQQQEQKLGHHEEENKEEENKKEEDDCLTIMTISRRMSKAFSVHSTDDEEDAEKNFRSDFDSRATTSVLEDPTTPRHSLGEHTSRSKRDNSEIGENGCSKSSLNTTLCQLKLFASKSLKSPSNNSSKIPIHEVRKSSLSRTSSSSCAAEFTSKPHPSSSSSTISTDGSCSSPPHASSPCSSAGTNSKEVSGTDEMVGSMRREKRKKTVTFAEQLEQVQVFSKVS
eukprot:GDKJ01027690.1.p1 GENE.GDKJ01027690.1~~GDKJ01027690.1.p1  ORF type:complete len:631 (+),score=117.33 GDKJ01027690.1:53-1945(+)